MSRTNLIVAAVAAAVLGAVVSCAVSSESSSSSEGITEIASVLPLTGVASELGQDMRRGQELAAEYVNTRPGVQRSVRLTFEDSRASPVEGTRAVQHLLARGFRLFVVPLSTVGMAVRPILEDAGALTFLNGSHPELTRPPHPLVFRHSQTAEAEARAIALEVERQGAGELFVFYLDDEYGRTFLDELGRSVAMEVHVEARAYEAATTDLRTVVQASGLRTATGALVVAVGVGRPLGLLIKALREDGYRGAVFASLGYIASGSRAVLGADREGIVYTDLSWTNREATDWLKVEYEHRFGREVPAGAVLEFQTVLMIAVAASKASDTSPERVAAHVAAAARAVVGVPPTHDNDILPVVLMRMEPDGRPL